MKTKYSVIRDTREQQGWTFNRTEHCAGTIKDQHLDVADYTVNGLQDVFLIERKGSVGEFSGNIASKDKDRFFRELDKLNLVKHAYVFLEFTMDDLYRYPWSDASIPSKVKSKIRINGRFLAHLFAEIQVKYPNIHFEFVGKRGSEQATVLFKLMTKLYPDKVINGEATV